MDFNFSPEAVAAGELTRDLLADVCQPDSGRFAAELWSRLAHSGIVGLGVPESYGGAGLPLIDLGQVLVEVGRVVAPVPLATHLAAVQLLTEVGYADLLPGCASGETVLGIAVAEARDHVPSQPRVTASVEGLLSGEKFLVRSAEATDHLLVTATDDRGPAVYLVAADAPGLDLRLGATSDGDRVGSPRFTDCPALRLGGPETVGRLHDLLTVCTSAELLGITRGALHLTAKYAGTREQFGRPIGTFQAVSQRLADGYIDTLCQELTLWQALWRVSERLPATTEVAIAKLWAADAAHRVAHTTVHVHGGVGIDLDGEAHRYFTAAKRFEFVAGGATEQAVAVGRNFTG